MRLGVGAALVGGTLVPGDVEIDGSVIGAVGCTPAGGGDIAVAGFVDLQVNGFAGVDFAGATAVDYDLVGPAMLATGVTAYQPTFISLPEDAYEPALAVAARAQREVASPRLLGVHLEGPFISALRSGAHDAANTRDADLALADRMLAAGPVTYVTVAPERRGAGGLISHLTSAGVLVALGHSDATAAEAESGFDRGARAVTHLFNASRPWRHRDPGISGAALVRDDIVVTVILDGLHLAAETVELIRRSAPRRVALITDAIAAAARPDGVYRLGDRAVAVASGKATLEDGTLAGSVLTMDLAVRNYVEHGASVAEAMHAATSVPARLIGRTELADLQPGTPADAVVLDDSLQVVKTVVRGEVVFAA